MGLMDTATDLGSALPVPRWRRLACAGAAALIVGLTVVGSAHGAVAQEPTGTVGSHLSPVTGDSTFSPTACPSKTAVA